MHNALKYLPLALTFSICLVGTAVGEAPQTEDANEHTGSAVQRGSIELEQAERHEESYSDVQEQANAYIKAIKTAVDTLATGATASPPPQPSESVIRFLTASYLKCSVDEGKCPFVLQTLLEADLIKSKETKSAACPALEKFWDIWLSDDMEKRHQYMVRTGYINVTTEFKRQERPKFIRCTDTIKTELASTESDKEYFIARYKPGNDPRTAPALTVTLLDSIKEKTPNIFGSVGVRLQGGK